MMNFKALAPTLPALLLGALLTGGCSSGPDTNDNSTPQAAILGVELNPDNTITEKFDLNGDGKADVWKHYALRGDPKLPHDQRPKVLARQDLDLNFDNNVDVRRYFDAKGAVVREEMDLDFDAKFDAVDYFSDGELYRRDLALNFNGVPSIIKFYNGSQLSRKERDTTGNGKMDTVEYYKDGKLIRVGIDRDGDGKPDDYQDVQQDS